MYRYRGGTKGPVVHRSVDWHKSVDGVKKNLAQTLKVGWTYKVPRDDLPTNANGFMSGVAKLGTGRFDDFTVNLIGPSTVIPEHASGLGDLSIECQHQRPRDEGDRSRA